ERGPHEGRVLVERLRHVLDGHARVLLLERPVEQRDRSGVVREPLVEDVPDDQLASDLLGPGRGRRAGGRAPVVRASVPSAPGGRRDAEPPDQPQRADPLEPGLHLSSPITVTSPTFVHEPSCRRRRRTAPRRRSLSPALTAPWRAPPRSSSTSPGPTAPT